MRHIRRTHKNLGASRPSSSIACQVGLRRRGPCGRTLPGYKAKGHTPQAAPKHATRLCDQSLHQCFPPTSAIRERGVAGWKVKLQRQARRFKHRAPQLAHCDDKATRFPQPVFGLETTSGKPCGGTGMPAGSRGRTGEGGGWAPCPPCRSLHVMSCHDQLPSARSRRGAALAEAGAIAREQQVQPAGPRPRVARHARAALAAVM